MLAEEGSLDELRKVVATCNDPEAQGHFVTALKDAKPAVSASRQGRNPLGIPSARGLSKHPPPTDPQALRHVCGDAALVKSLMDWLDDLLAARSGTHEHVLIALLAQLGSMPFKAPVLKQVSVCLT